MGVQGRIQRTKKERKKGCGPYRRGIWVPKFARKENEIRIVKMEKSKVTRTDGGLERLKGLWELDSFAKP